MGDFEWRIKKPAKILTSQWFGIDQSDFAGGNFPANRVLRPDRESEQKYKKLDCEIIHGLDIQAIENHDIKVFLLFRFH